MYKLSLLAMALGPLGELLVTGPVAGILALWCMLSGERRGAFAIGAATAGVLASVSALKLVSNLTMAPWRFHWGSVSNLFPSGHVAMATVVYGAAALCIYRSVPRAGWAATAGAVGLVALIGLERVQSGSHPPLDVVGGALLGILGLALLSRLWPEGRLRATGIPAVAATSGLVLLMFYGDALPTSWWVEQVARSVRSMLSIVVSRLSS